MTRQGTIVGVFQDRGRAQQAVRELKDAGFKESEIGVASAANEGGDVDQENAEDSYAGEGALAGAATGAGVGALWGLGILAGVLPAIGPAIAGGTLAVLLSSAAAGATAAGLAGALIGMGISREEAEYYESEFKAGRTIVSVNAGTRATEARAILSRFGAYDMSTRSTSAGAASDSACATGPSSAGGRSSSQETGTVQATNEKLQVQKKPVQTGEAIVRKETHTEHKTIDVPVTREEIVVERHAGSGHPVSGQQLGAGQELHIPITEEQVEVEKRQVAGEAVTVGKRQVKDSQRVDETLRKEQIKVETKGNAKVRDEKRSP
jgi:uncharacterized protein (TIGR02271 family)